MRKKKKSSETWPTIRKRGKSFQVDTGRVLPKRLRKSFSTVEEAEEFAGHCRREKKLIKEKEKHERENRSVTLGKLTDTQRAEVIQAYDLLEDSRGLVGAVSFFVDHHKQREDSKTLEQVHDAYMEMKGKKNLRARSLKNIEARLKSFVWDNRNRPAESITTYDIEKYLDDKGGAWSTRETYRLAFFGLFAWAVKQSFIPKNPVAQIERQEKDETLPSIHTPAEVKRILKKAAELKPEMIPYFALGYFAGLRPENELRNLAWHNVNIADREIYVEAATAKKRRSRFVTMSDNLAQWLAEYPQVGPTVYFSRRAFRAIKKAAGVDWTQDVMRHSFGTYHLAEHRDKNMTASEMGHSDVDVLMAHYQRPVKKSVANTFWKIGTESIEGNITKIKTRAG